MYTVEKLENNMVVLEDRETKEHINVDITNFMCDIKENDIVIFDAYNNVYVRDEAETKRIKNNLRSRFNRLKK